MENNPELKQCLETLAQHTLPIYAEKVGTFTHSYDEQIMASIELHKLDNIIFETPEFIKCLGLMEEDEHIKLLQGELVGTRSERTIVRNEKTCILSFLEQLFNHSPQYQQEVYEQKYQAFEDFFYSDVLRFRASVKLYNFQSDMDCITLSKNICIKKSVYQFEPQNEHSERLYRPYVTFSKSNYSIEIEYDTEKIIGDKPAAPDDIAKDESTLTAELFDLVISALRLLKPSAVYRDHRIESKNITFHPHGGTSTRSSFYENIVLGKKCELSSEDVSEIKKKFEFLVSEKDSRFLVAQRRFSGGIERRVSEDRLLDYMIGLEALYLPDGNQELSFRLSLRIAYLLTSDSTKRKELYEFMRNMYEVRSKIVHGKDYKLTEEDIEKLENILRKSVKLWIDDKQNFTKSTFTNSGKLIKIGKLDNLFFE